MQTAEPNAVITLQNTAQKTGQQVEKAMHADLNMSLGTFDPLLAEVLEYALFNGGKRIRPLLTILSSRCCGQEEGELHLLAAAFEYLHVATLLHDDVLDHAQQRRGRPSVVARFGITPAILAGDWLHARSMHLIGRLAGAKALEVFCRATESMVNGEFLQSRYIGDLHTNEDNYFAVIQQKTGNLISSTCAIGALFAGASEKEQHALTQYGDFLGAAFQVVDDLLDYLGQKQVTGKQTGNDFIEGKITLPVLFTWKQADLAEKKVLEQLFAGDRTDPEAYNRLHNLIQKRGGFDYAAEKAQSLVHQALAALAPFADQAQPNEALTLLQALAAYILSRKK